MIYGFVIQRPETGRLYAAWLKELNDCDDGDQSDCRKDEFPVIHPQPWRLGIDAVSPKHKLTTSTALVMSPKKRSELGAEFPE